MKDTKDTEDKGMHRKQKIQRVQGTQRMQGFSILPVDSLVI